MRRLCLLATAATKAGVQQLEHHHRLGEGRQRGARRALPLARHLRQAHDIRHRRRHPLLRLLRLVAAAAAAAAAAVERLWREEGRLEQPPVEHLGTRRLLALRLEQRRA
eukprot:scaffold17348_cov36-Phaeocystis_antarctica.AAC.2